MPNSATIFAIAAAALLGIGLGGVFVCGHMLRKILAVNIAGSGVFLLFGALARRGGSETADPVPHALVLTGIVVAVCATAVALVLYRRLSTDDGSPRSTEEPRS